MADDVARAKVAAARYAVEHFVRAGQRLALGSGSTTNEAVKALAGRFPKTPFECVAASRATEDLARSLGLAVRSLRAGDRFAVMLDGADEVSPALDLTKGGGGALLREKLLARLSDDVVILVDPSKLVRALGERHRIPIEVVPFARPAVEHAVEARGYRSHLRTAADGRPYRTDNGNEILDLAPSHPIDDPATEDAALSEITGIVETGLFVGLARHVVVGHADGHVEDRPRPTGAARPN